MNSGTFLDKTQLDLLKKLDRWLIEESMWMEEDNKGFVESIRTLITKIEKRGYYSDSEALVLNEIRAQYIKDKKNKKV